MSSAEAKESVIPVEEMRGFVSRCMQKVGVTEEHAGDLAELLVKADLRGHYSHGLNRLDMYIADIKTGMSAKEGTPTVLKEMPASAWVDGNNILGPSVGKFCMDLAIKKAKEAGVGWVCAKGSNHFGIAGWYAMRAAEQGLMGMAFTNTSPLVVPTRSKARQLGTNPIAVAAPGKDGDEFVLDMATSTVALGKVELAGRKAEEIPLGWGVDDEGQELRDPNAVSGLCPLGGSERTGGYKGYGLGAMVEVFCGVMAGAHWGPNVRRWKASDNNPADLGQCFVAVNTGGFAPGFEGRMQDLMDSCRGLEPAAGEKEVLVAGDPERQHIALCDKLGGIPYHPNQVVYANEIAKDLGVAPPKTL